MGQPSGHIGPGRLKLNCHNRSINRNGLDKQDRGLGKAKVEASASFLKKRSKKLLLNIGLGTSDATTHKKQKFFVLFFKKERLSSVST
jgi:hypothetical protein